MAGRREDIAPYHELGPLFLLWGFAPAIMSIVFMFLAMLVGPAAIVIHVILSTYSQILWSMHLLDLLNAPEKDRVAKVILITLLGLFVNTAIFFGGCHYFLSSMVSAPPPGIPA